jgi:predicted MPP superfamily phosphohydrolase
MQMLRYLLLLAALSGLGHGLLARWALRVFPRLRANAQRRRVKYVAIALTFAPIVARIATHTLEGELAERFYAATMMEFILVGICSVPIGIIELAEYLSARRRAKLAARSGDRAEPTTAEAPPMLSRREALERVGGLAVIGTTTATLGWGMVRGRHAFEIDEVPVRIPGLPRVLDGYTIAQISDIHAGLFVGERELREGLDRVREVRPDMIVVTGDLVDYDPRFAPMMARAIADLNARDGVFAILGNHDYYTGRDAIVRALAATKIDLLVNAGRRIRPADGGGFALLGTDDRWAEHYGTPGPDLARAIAMVPPDLPRILLAHQPKFFEEAAGKVALQLSGHTHGGQINPGIRPADIMLMRFISGRYEAQGSTMWVNRGFGVAGPPARIGAPPEVTKIVLVAA